jgi:4-hydroxy-3-polyprenylbenzoate decarboxylase
MPYDSLRPYLASLEQQGLMRWIDKPVDKNWEISAIGRMIFRGMAENRRYGFGFRNIKGHPDARVVSGVVAASTKMMSVALECEPTPAAIHERTIRGIAHPIEAKVVKSGPCKDTILGPDELDLTKFPVPVWTPGKDAGPYLTPLWVTKDPDNGVRNVGIRRAQIKGRNKTGILFGAPDRGGAIHHEKWKARGKPMPAAMYIGADPVHYLVAPGRYGTDELAIAGGIREQAVEVVKCETVDVEVPATAEIVIEGEIPTDYIETEGPFGEFTGFMAGGRKCPVFNVKCITHRKDPILLGIISQFPPSESSTIKRNLLEANLLKHLAQTLRIPGIVDLHALESGGCTATLWVSLKKMYTGHVDQLAMAVLGYFGMSYYKWIVIADEDDDIRDPFMREWILSWRVNPARDMRILPNTAAIELDPSGHPPEEIPDQDLGSKVIIDATRRWKYPGISLPSREHIEQVVERWSSYGLPPLDDVRLPKFLS